MSKKPAIKISRNIQVRDLDKGTAKNLDQFKENHLINTDAKAVCYMINRDQNREDKILALKQENSKLIITITDQVETIELIRTGFEALNSFKISIDNENG